MGITEPGSTSDLLANNPSMRHGMKNPGLPMLPSRVKTKILESHGLFRFPNPHYAKTSLSQHVHQDLYAKCSKTILKTFKDSDRDDRDDRVTQALEDLPHRRQGHAIGMEVIRGRAGHGSNRHSADAGDHCQLAAARQVVAHGLD